MNHGLVHDLASLRELIVGEPIQMNQRIAKAILREQNLAELPAFLLGMTDEFLYDLYRFSIGDDTARMESFRDSVHVLEEILQQRGMIRNDRLLPPTNKN